MVATAQQAEQALFGDDGIVKALPQGAVLYLTSTVPSAYAQSVEKKLRDVGRGDVLFIDAPVSGGAIRAADGTLSIMAGASEEAFAKGKFLLEELTAEKKLFIVEGGVGAGSNMKMVHQVLAAIHIAAVSEAFGFAARLGVNGGDVREHVIGGKAWSWMFENRSVRTLKEDYFPGASAVTIIIKDTVCIWMGWANVWWGKFAWLTTTAGHHYFHGESRGFPGAVVLHCGAAVYHRLEQRLRI